MTTFGANMQDMTFYQLQQQTQQLIQQQNAYLAAQLQLSRSQSLNNQQCIPTPAAPLAKQPAQRSLSDTISHYHANKRAQQLEAVAARSPPGLSSVPQTSEFSRVPQTSSVNFPTLPQAPCISLQRRDSVKSDGSASATTVSASRYKTEMCRPFEETGHCRYGSKCQFAHGETEKRDLNRHPRYKTECCRTFHTTGFCSYGQRCNFIHNEDERRAPAPAVVSNARPQGLHLAKQHMPLSVSSSIGSSPASSIYGDMSPSHSPNYLSDDPFTASTCSRLSPAPSLSSFASDISNRSFPSPPSTPPHSDDFGSSDKLIDLSSILNALSFRQ